MKAGDIVKLISGGPKMTIAWVEDDTVLCDWFTQKNELKNSRFILDQLEFSPDSE